METFRFQDEYDYEYEIFSILSSARAKTNVFLAGKGDSRVSEYNYSGAPLARSGAPWVRKFGNLPIRKILVIT